MRARVERRDSKRGLGFGIRGRDSKRGLGFGIRGRGANICCNVVENDETS